MKHFSGHIIRFIELRLNVRCLNKCYSISMFEERYSRFIINIRILRALLYGISLTYKNHMKQALHAFIVQVMFL